MKRVYNNYLLNRKYNNYKNTKNYKPDNSFNDDFRFNYDKIMKLIRNNLIDIKVTSIPKRKIQPLYVVLKSLVIISMFSSLNFLMNMRRHLSFSITSWILLHM